MSCESLSSVFLEAQLTIRSETCLVNQNSMPSPSPLFRDATNRPFNAVNLDERGSGEEAWPRKEACAPSLLARNWLPSVPPDVMTPGGTPWLGDKTMDCCWKYWFWFP